MEKYNVYLLANEDTGHEVQIATNVDEADVARIQNEMDALGVSCVALVTINPVGEDFTQACQKASSPQVIKL